MPKEAQCPDGQSYRSASTGGPPSNAEASDEELEELDDSEVVMVKKRFMGLVSIEDQLGLER